MPAKQTSKKPTRSPKAKKSTSTKKKSVKSGEEEVTIDRRKTERREEENAAAEVESPAPERRQKVQRRRQIDPTTCERDYTDDEVEFMNAMDEYKRQSGRMFPTCSEVLEVIRNLGYTRLSPAELALQNESAPEGEALGAEASSEEDQFGANTESEELAASGWAI